MTDVGVLIFGLFVAAGAVVGIILKNQIGRTIETARRNALEEAYSSRPGWESYGCTEGLRILLGLERVENCELGFSELGYVVARKLCKCSNAAVAHDAGCLKGASGELMRRHPWYARHETHLVKWPGLPAFMPTAEGVGAYAEVYFRLPDEIVGLPAWQELIATTKTQEWQRNEALTREEHWRQFWQKKPEKGPD